MPSNLQPVLSPRLQTHRHTSFEKEEEFHSLVVPFTSFYRYSYTAFSCLRERESLVNFFTFFLVSQFFFPLCFISLTSFYLYSRAIKLLFCVNVHLDEWSAEKRREKRRERRGESEIAVVCVASLVHFQVFPHNTTLSASVETESAIFSPLSCVRRGRGRGEEEEVAK